LPDDSEIRLVRMGHEHLQATCRWLQASPQLRQQIDCLHAPTPEENLRYWQARWKEPRREDYAVIEGGVSHVGNCGLSEIDARRSKAQLWIYLGGSYGRGIGTAALNRLMRRAFLDLELNRLYLRVLETNTRAVEFYCARGFVREGVGREDTLRDGSYVDSVWFSMLAREYRSLETRT
jgi:RimJ/RimL family protein N-acetyltransferase